MDPERLAAAYAYCGAELARHDRDRWLADLLLPADKRRHAHAIHAFSLDVARIREGIHEALPGEVRLQWWIDAIEGEARGDVSAHPVAAAFIDTIHRFSLRRQDFVDLVAARRFDLYDDPWPTLNELEGYAGGTASVLFRQLARVLCGGDDPAAAGASAHAGIAYALTGLLRALPIHARRNQVFVPLEILERHGLAADDIRAGRLSPGLYAALADMRAAARVHLEAALAALPQVEPAARPAFVPLALVGPYLKALAKGAPERRPFERIAEIAPWRKPLLLWRFGRRL